MNKYQVYNEMKEKINNHEGNIGPYTEINYGIQFDVTINNLTSKVRVYESKKKGITVDLSQVKYDELKDILLNINGSKSTHNGQTERKSDDMVHSLIGVDESGKGDYFGPLVIAAVYADEETKKKLIKLGVADSKKLSDKQIANLAEYIKMLCQYEVMTIDNQTYNKLYYKIQNLNTLLAKGHAKVIYHLAQRTNCQLALSDQFGDEALIKKELENYDLSIELEQRPRAESNVVVAAASILARDAFVMEMEKLSVKYGQTFPKGAGSQTIEAGRYYINSFGREGLVDVAKLHFKTTEQF